MQAVGRLGSYISKGVYTVSGPFHPFGGAVDIIVVQQRDGSYKSSPWYVRFGKFQGVLKSKEKLVSIHVNGVEAEDLHMCLDHTGEAFFLKEVDVEEGVALCSPTSSSGEDTERQPRTNCPLKSKSCNYDSTTTWSNSSEFDKEAIIRSNSRRAQFLGAGYGMKSSRKDDVIIHEEENVTGVIRTESLERAEMAADLLDLKWSTNLLSSRCRKKDFPPRDTSKDELNKNLQVNVCSTGETDLISNSVKEMENGAGENGVVEASLIRIVRENENVTGSEGDGLSLIHEEKISVREFLHGASENIVAESYSHSTSVHPLNGSSEIAESESVISISSSSISPSVPAETETKTILAVETPGDPQILSSDVLDTFLKTSTITEEEKLLFGDLYDSCSNDAKHFCLTKEAESSCSSGVVNETNEFANAKCYLSIPLDQSIINDYIDNASMEKTRLRKVASDACIGKIDRLQSKELTRMTRSLPTALSRNNLEASDLTQSSDSSFLDAKAGAANYHINGNLLPCNSSLKGSQRSWPVPCQKSEGVKVSDHDMDSNSDPNPTETLQNRVDLEGTKVKTNKKKVKTLTPTSEQLASLNLKEGKNTVVFTFSTSMLGTQQVDARIFLWRWDTRIVISDVDGTITRSDLLGQVMPLVGMDWSQTGVAHLFSAIKENGYELIFLSARSISQSFITRQFLFNIKQDGKALPEGPVVISPDGLFPSLFREVVRRAPHEFKIACLEDIKALFPADSNPFYAGFGNRDTDEFSYLKVGIPSGKIFIINPKGDIVVNRRVSKKSYSSLHTLVHGMFPSTSSSEQEDFNSWNFWKLPPPLLDI